MHPIPAYLQRIRSFEPRALATLVPTSLKSNVASSSASCCPSASQCGGLSARFPACAGTGQSITATFDTSAYIGKSANLLFQMFLTSAAASSFDVKVDGVKVATLTYNACSPPSAQQSVPVTINQATTTIQIIGPTNGNNLMLVATQPTATSTPANTNYANPGNYLTMTLSVAPATPTGLTATAQSGSVALTWNPVTGATSYNVYRSLVPDGANLLAASSASGYTDTSVVNGTTYYYSVSAVDSAGESALSPSVSATPPVPPPPPPPTPMPTGVVVTPAVGSVALTWNVVAGATYNVYRGISANPAFATVIATPDQNKYTDFNVVNGNTYYYFISASMRPSGESTLTTGISAIPLQPPVPSPVTVPSPSPLILAPSPTLVPPVQPTVPFPTLGPPVQYTSPFTGTPFVNPFTGQPLNPVTAPLVGFNQDPSDVLPMPTPQHVPLPPPPPPIPPPPVKQETFLSVLQDTEAGFTKLLKDLFGWTL